MTQITDMVDGLIAYLQNDADVIVQVATRIFGEELPRSETDSMPRKCVVIASSGGAIPPWAGATVKLEVRRVDLFCYGATLYEAEEVRRAVFGAMRALKRVLSAAVLIHWAQPAGGAAAGREGPISQWNLQWNSWHVCSDERDTA